MKNLFKLFGIVALAAIIGFSVIACDLLGGEEEGENNSYKGTWNGSITNKAGVESDDAKIVFTDDGWTLTSTKANLNASGKYTFTRLGATLKSGAYTEFSASALLSTLTLSGVSTGAYAGYSGNFVKEGSKNTSFEGTWEGSITADQETADDAKIVFTATGWTLTSTMSALNETGTYTTDLLGRAILVKGTDSFGTATVFGSTLILTAAADGEFDGGSGTFVKEGTKPSNTNPYTGTWKGTITIAGAAHEATVVFTDTTWTLTCAGITTVTGKTGSYERNGSTATLKDGTYSFGSTYIFGSTLTLTGASGGPLAGGTGKFTK